MKTLGALLLFTLIISCAEQRENNRDTVYLEILLKMSAELERLGKWEYAPDGKDSIWQKGLATNNLSLLDDVLKSIEPIEREWDSLMFIAKKYDSIPLPSQGIVERQFNLIEDKIWLIKYRITLSSLVEQGVYDGNGKKLKEF